MNTAITRNHTTSSMSHRWGRFLRHYAEMSMVMVVGMLVAVTLFMYSLNIWVERIEWEEALTKYPAYILIVVAIGMSVPMVPWMLWRGHSRRSAYEMAVVMAAPAIPFIALALLDVIEGAQCSLYCITGFVAMFGLMWIRREEYVHN